jgi:hypothetical protein
MLLVRDFCWKIRRNVLLARRSHYEVMTDSRHMKMGILLTTLACLLLASVALCLAGCQPKEQVRAQGTPDATTSTNATTPAKPPEHPEHPK